MRKSREVPLTVLAALALSSTACNHPPVSRNCVDAHGHVVPESECQSHATGVHYVYGGSSGGHIGDTVVGGSDTEEGVSRGGLGHGEGDAEGAAHGSGDGAGE